MSQNKIKYLGYALSVAGALIGMGADWITRKQLVANMADSKELKDLIDKAVQEALKAK
jgi:hypothetical protein